MDIRWSMGVAKCKYAHTHTHSMQIAYLCSSCSMRGCVWVSNNQKHPCVYFCHAYVNTLSFSIAYIHVFIRKCRQIHTYVCSSIRQLAMNSSRIDNAQKEKYRNYRYLYFRVRWQLARACTCSIDESITMQYIVGIF